MIAFGEVSQYGYYTLGSSNSLVDHDESEIKEIKLLPSCELILSFNNVNCFDSNDAVQYEFDAEYGSISYIPNPIFGCTGFQFETETVRAGNINLNYNVTRNGVTESFSELFYLVPFQENEIVINY